jgi:hypothetical protein
MEARMPSQKVRIPAREAFDAIQNLLTELEKIDRSKLRRRGSTALKSNKERLTQSADEWERFLRDTLMEIEEWCPQFTIEEDPKPR